MQTFFDSTLFTWVVLPILIFFARIVDMSFDTMRIIMVGRGRKVVAAVLGFFEVSIWLLVARQVIANLPNIGCFFAYAFGFATGNFVGMWIEERMAGGAQSIRVIVSQNGGKLAEALKSKGYGVTVLPAQGAKGPVDMLFTVANRKDMQSVIQIIELINPQSFYTIEDVRYANEGIFPAVTTQKGWQKFTKRK